MSESALSLVGSLFTFSWLDTPPDNEHAGPQRKLLVLKPISTFLNAFAPCPQSSPFTFLLDIKFFSVHLSMEKSGSTSLLFISLFPCLVGCQIIDGFLK